MASEDAIEPLEVMELVFLVSNKLPCSFDTSRRRLSGLQELLLKVVGNNYLRPGPSELVMKPQVNQPLLRVEHSQLP